MLLAPSVAYVVCALVRVPVAQVETHSETGTLTVARKTLRLSEVIGLQSHPGKWLRGEEVAPTLVIHVPSSLNAGYMNARVEFGPKTMSWLHRPSAAGVRGGRPRVIVPLHLERDHPARAHSTRKPANEVANSPRARAIASARAARTSDSGGGSARQDGTAAGATKAARARLLFAEAPGTQWSEGWVPACLPFPHQS